MPRPTARTLVLCLALLLGACTPAVQAPPPSPPPAPAASLPKVGGAVMDPDYTFVQNLGASADHRILSAAIRASGAATILASAGSYTLFAPTDPAFGTLPNGTVEALMSPRSRAELDGVVNAHILQGARTSSRIEADIRAGGGQALYRSLAGQMVRATMSGDAILLTDGNGRQARISQGDVTQANGVMHVIDAVLLPTG